MPESILDTELKEHIEDMKLVKTVINQENERADELINQIKSVNIETLKTTEAIDIGEEVLSFKRKYINQDIDDTDDDCGK